MKTAVVLAAGLAVQAGTAFAGDVFLSSPPYDILVTLEYTDPADPYGSQGYIESYKATSMFSGVVFGPSFSPEFPAMFSIELGPSGSGGVMPANQISGTGVIESFTLQPAWESDDEPIEGRVTSGPDRFEPNLTVIPFDLAMEYKGSSSDDDMPLVPLVPTMWILYHESFSLSDPELQWEYPDFAANYIASSAVVFSVPLGDLGQGRSFELHEPYESETAIGQWTIRFEAAE